MYVTPIKIVSFFIQSFVLFSFSLLWSVSVSLAIDLNIKQFDATDKISLWILILNAIYIV